MVSEKTLGQKNSTFGIKVMSQPVIRISMDSLGLRKLKSQNDCGNDQFIMDFDIPFYWVMEIQKHLKPSGIEYLWHKCKYKTGRMC